MIPGLWQPKLEFSLTSRKCCSLSKHLSSGRCFVDTYPPKMDWELCNTYDRSTFHSASILNLISMDTLQLVPWYLIVQNNVLFYINQLIYAWKSVVRNPVFIFTMHVSARKNIIEARLTILFWSTVSAGASNWNIYPAVCPLASEWNIHLQSMRNRIKMKYPYELCAQSHQNEISICSLCTMASK